MSRSKIYRQIALLFCSHFLLLIPNISATLLKGRGNCCGSATDDCVTDDDPAGINSNINEQPDDATDDKRPSIGIEFETSWRYLEPKNPDACGQTLINLLKGHAINPPDHHGDAWELTADTSIHKQLSLEYILNGKEIYVGDNDARRAAGQVAADYTSWNPHGDMANNEHHVEGSDPRCDPWVIVDDITRKGASAVDVRWSPQVTAPMPFEAILELVRYAWNNQPSALLPPGLRATSQGFQVYITKDFFQASSGGFSADDVKDDALGFFSILMTWVKLPNNAENDWEHDPATSYKMYIGIMPRTDFTSMYSLFKESNTMQGSLYDMVKKLACYNNEDNGNAVSGTLADPKTNDFLDTITFKAFDRTNPQIINKLTVKDWIASIEAGTSPDELTKLDLNIDGSIGALRDRTESVLGTQRQVPLFEFRKLENAATSEFADRADAYEQEVVRLHNAHANAARFIKQREVPRFSHIKRQGLNASCPTATISGTSTETAPPTTSAPPMPSCSYLYAAPDNGIEMNACVCGSVTLPPLTLTNAPNQEASCSYTAMPSSSVANPITIPTQYWTNNCQACTLIGGIADAATCTSVGGCTPTSAPKPVLAIEISNNSIPIGNADNFDDGKDLRTDFYTQLQNICPDSSDHCDSTQTAEVHGIPIIIGEEVDFEVLSLVVQDSHYSSKDDRDRMLAAAMATWQQAVSKSCKEVEYHDDEPDVGSGCGNGALVNQSPFTDPQNNRRAARCKDCPRNDHQCRYNGTLCTGADHIHANLAGSSGPYENYMDIAFSVKLDGVSAFDEFICEVAVNGLNDLAMAIAPELAGPDIMEDIDLQAACESLAGGL
ncbi:hypothetical protein K491DRAFT_730354 [Lophiostoma macrostomum CBS 122681]|uniref:Uncharacterized protein n=1 Tax=Lophiostoma macrostomum CBS 122681 TaxID=1314788 RepID=A0A6A6STQ3_9PLEO|nr:hypothetical protein K491DRAFT_730354 [Lophiostoma macrostomum CBS 122681]